MLLPAFAGLESVGAVRVVSNLVLPILHLNAALGVLLLPALASVATERSRFYRTVAGGLGALVAGSLVYWARLTTFRVPVLDSLYDGVYTDSAALVPVLALVPLAAAGSGVFASALRAFERPQQVVWVYVASAAVTVTVGVALTAGWGAIGAAAGFLRSPAVTMLGCGVLLALHRRRRATTGLDGTGQA
jgi:O-antigen/teichoic acid export membrane protein